MDNVVSINGDKQETRQPLFNGELRTKLLEVAPEGTIMSIETEICKFTVLKLREFGELLGNTVANKVISFFGGN